MFQSSERRQTITDFYHTYYRETYIRSIRPYSIRESSIPQTLTLSTLQFSNRGWRINACTCNVKVSRHVDLVARSYCYEGFLQSPHRVDALLKCTISFIRIITAQTTSFASKTDNDDGKAKKYRKRLKFPHQEMRISARAHPIFSHHALRILSVLNRRFVWKSSETQDSIYVGPCIGHSQVNRSDKNPFVMSRRFVVSAFGCSCCHAILIGLERRRLLIGGLNRPGTKAFPYAERNESKKRVLTKRSCLRDTECFDCMYAHDHSPEPAIK